MPASFLRLSNPLPSMQSLDWSGRGHGDVSCSFVVKDTKHCHSTDVVSVIDVGFLSVLGPGHWE